MDCAHTATPEQSPVPLLGLFPIKIHRIFSLVLLWISNSPLMLYSVMTTIQCSTPRGQRFKPTILKQHKREVVHEHWDTKSTHRGHRRVWLRTESLTNLELCLAPFQHLSMPGGQRGILPLTFIVFQIFNSPENQMQELVIMTGEMCCQHKAFHWLIC